MSSLNRVQIIGNLGADPEVRTFPNGGKVCNLRVATSEKWKDKSTGEKRERTEWHSVAIFADGLVGIAERYLRKGSKVYLEGQLETRKWQDRDGRDRHSTEIVLRPYGGTIVMLGDPGGGGRDDRRDDDRGGYREDRRDDRRDRRDDDRGGQGGGYGGGYPDDEIPF